PESISTSPIISTSPLPERPSIGDVMDQVEIDVDREALQRLVEAVGRGRGGTGGEREGRVWAGGVSLAGACERLRRLDRNRIQEYPHQVAAALRVLREMRGRALLADEVGLGKTIEAGLVMQEYVVRGIARTVLILTPPSLTRQWQAEMVEKF